MATRSAMLQRGLEAALPTVALTVLPSAAEAECPTNSLVCTNYYPPVTERLLSTDPQAALWCSSYDLRLGHVAASAQSGHFEIFANSEVCVEDEYQASGGTPGGLLTIRAEWHLTGSIASSPSCFPGYEAANGAYILATLTEPQTGESVSFDAYTPPGECDENCCYGSSAPVDRVMSLSIQVAEGSAFHLKFCAGAGAAGGYATLQGRLSFQDLPPGITIRSCQGFVQDEPVQMRSTSWGRAKAIYR